MQHLHTWWLHYYYVCQQRLNAATLAAHLSFRRETTHF